MDQMFPTPGQELPKPERIEPQTNSGEYVVPYPEQIEQAAPGERISQAASAVAQATDNTATVQLPVIGVTTPVPQQGNSTPGAGPVVADDADVIEKEWVEKAKDIVAKTKTDPHLQSVELTSFKHDYMKKRYGKEIKLPDDRAV